MIAISSFDFTKQGGQTLLAIHWTKLFGAVESKIDSLAEALRTKLKKFLHLSKQRTKLCLRYFSLEQLTHLKLPAH